MSFSRIRYQSDRLAVVENEEGWQRVKLKPGVAILPVKANGDILMVQEYRETATGRVLQWNIPRGIAEPGESPLQTAKRELEEETALDVPQDRFVQLAGICQDSGLLLETTPIVAAVLQGLEIVPMADGGEIESIRAFAEEEIYDLAMRNELTDGFTLSALTLWRAFCRLHGVTRAGTKNQTVSVSAARDPELYASISKYQEQIAKAGWTVTLLPTRAIVSAAWLPGQRPGNPQIDAPDSPEGQELRRLLA